jgi:hypothetical protein
MFGALFVPTLVSSTHPPLPSLHHSLPLSPPQGAALMLGPTKQPLPAYKAHRDRAAVEYGGIAHNMPLVAQMAPVGGSGTSTGDLCRAWEGCLGSMFCSLILHGPKWSLPSDPAWTQMEPAVQPVYCNVCCPQEQHANHHLLACSIPTFSC